MRDLLRGIPVDAGEASLDSRRGTLRELAGEGKRQEDAARELCALTGKGVVCRVAILAGSCDGAVIGRRFRD
jgi:hypothetical protein